MGAIDILRTLLNGLVTPCCVLLVCLGVTWFIHVFGERFLRSVGGRGIQTAVFVLLGVAATLVGGGKGNGHRSPVPPHDDSDSLDATTTEEGVQDDSRFRIVRIALTNDTFEVESSWTNGHFAAGTVLDYLVKTNLTDVAWGWDGAEQVIANVTNSVHNVALEDYAQTVEGVDGLTYRVNPKQLFVCIVPRLPVSDLRDSDRDGIPDNYEMWNQGNPWVQDYDSVVRKPLNVETNLQQALNESTPYQILEMEPGEYVLSDKLVLPQHPVMLCAREPYALIRSSAVPGVFELAAGQTGQTLFQNLYLWLDARANYQSAFWCGGNLAWSGVSASASFRNIYVRMPRPGVQYFGWHFYRWSTNAADIAYCTMNAAGATRANGVYGYDPPPIKISNCSFLNFPTNRLSAKSCGIYLATSAQNYGAVSNAIPVTVAGSLFDQSFTNALPLARVESGTNFLVRAENSITPSGFAEGHVPDVTARLWTTNAGVTWCGIPLPGGQAAMGGVGAHVVLSSQESRDSDGDATSDYVEVYLHRTDPWLVDSDGDGVSDASEREEGTDPQDVTFRKRMMSVTVTNEGAETDVMTHVCWSVSLDGWLSPRDEIQFSGQSFTTNYGTLLLPGPLYVKAFRDLNNDGLYTSGREPFLSRKAGYDRMEFDFSLSFGDVDGDRVSDETEFEQGTNPNNAKNFCFEFPLVVTNVDFAAGVTNFLTLGAESPGGAVEAFFSGAMWSTNVSTIVTNGKYQITAWRDLDRNGVLTPGVDTVFTKTLEVNDNGRALRLNIGDGDGDGIADSVELEKGTDHLNGQDCCFNLSLTYTDIFQTTNALTLEARFGTNTVWGPTVVTDETWSHNFGHCVTDRGEKPSVRIWDDVNRNGLWDLGECGNSIEIRPTSHDMVITNSLPYGNFDRDNDQLPDWWEVSKGLPIGWSPNEMFADPDEDGLINIHEYWLGKHPLVSDGSNTLFSICSRSVDGRIKNVVPSEAVDRFINFLPNATNGIYVANPNFWLRDVDTSCVSVWNIGAHSGGMPATAITRKHVVMSEHWHSAFYYFCDTNGVVYTRTIERSYNIPDSDMLIGQLNTPLPNSIRLPKVLSPEAVSSFSSWKYLPVVCISHLKSASVLEVENMDCSVFNTDRQKLYHRLGSLSRTNHVSLARNMIRGATEDGYSGTPAFLLVGHDLVFLYAKHMGKRDVATWSPSSGPLITHRLGEVQDKIDEWENASKNDFQVEVLDMSPIGLLDQ